MAYDAGDELRRPVLARFGGRRDHRLAARRLSVVAGFADPKPDDRIAASGRTGARVPGGGLAEPAEGGRNGRRPEGAGDGSGKGAVGSLRRSRLGAERARRSHQADQRRQACDLRCSGRGERQVARSCRRSTRGSRRKAIVWPACRPRIRRCPPSKPGCRDRSTPRAPPSPRPRTRPPPPRSSSRRCRTRSTRRPSNSTRLQSQIRDAKAAATPAQ